MFCHLNLSAYSKTRLAYKPCLFALPDYLAQITEEVHLFGVKNMEEALEGVLVVVFREGKAYSPPRATFGGWYGNTLPAQTEADFWAWAIDQMRSLGITACQIKLPAPCLPPRTFEVVCTDLNYQLPLQAGRAGKVHGSERRRLRKAQRAGLVAELWQNPDLEMVFDFIKEARKRKGFPLTLTRVQFLEMFARFPAHYQVFVVRDEAHALACLTVTVRIDDKTLYNFYPADSATFLAYSPMVLLLDFVQDWAFRQGFEVLDLGIATENGTRNEGLIRFKKNLGAIETAQYTVLRCF